MLLIDYVWNRQGQKPIEMQGAFSDMDSFVGFKRTNEDYKRVKIQFVRQREMTLEEECVLRKAKE